MRKSVIILISVLMTNAVAFSQSLSMPEVDEKTYALWSEKNWSGLIALGRDALKQGIDFYYLRVRLGIAYYEKENYHQAITHFKKAYSANPHEAYLNEYLYYAYLFSGRNEEALRVAASFPQEWKDKTGAGVRFMDGLYAFYGTNFLDNDITASYSIELDPLVNGSQVISKKYSFVNLGLKHRLTPSFSIDHSYTGLKKTNFVYYQKDGATGSKPEHTTTLNQYFVAGNLRVARNLNLRAGLHYVNTSYPVETLVFGQGRYSVRNVTISESDYVGLFSLEWRTSYLAAGGAYYHGGLNNARQDQTDLSVILYPFGNSHFYTISTVSLQSEKQDDLMEQRIIFNQEAGLRITRWMWAEGGATWGDLHNYVAGGGAVIYNSFETIRKKRGGRLILYPGKRWELRLDYSWKENESYFITDSSGENTNRQTYVNHSLTAGLFLTL